MIGDVHHHRSHIAAILHNQATDSLNHRLCVCLFCCFAPMFYFLWLVVLFVFFPFPDIIALLIASLPSSPLAISTVPKKKEEGTNPSKMPFTEVERKKGECSQGMVGMNGRMRMGLWVVGSWLVMH